MSTNLTSAKPLVHVSGAESAFSRAHRKLGRTLSLADLDFFQGQIQQGAFDINFHQDGANRNFFEYRLKNDKPTFVAFYDIKHVMSEYIQRELNTVRTGTSIWCMGELAAKVGARAFVAVESAGQLPIHFYEIKDGQSTYCGTLAEDSPAAVSKFWRNTLHIA